MKRTKILTFSCIIPLILIGWQQQGVITVPPHIEDLVQSANFVFIGTVKQLNAVTMSAVKAGDNTIIVTVDEVMKAAGSLKHYIGKDITVQLRQPDSLKRSQQFIFFTNGWLYGKSIAVREVGKLQIDGDREKKREQVIEGIKLVADKNLQRRIAGADLVVAGKVVKIEQAKALTKQQKSEHDPMWRTAVIEIESLVKGRFAQKNVRVQFPGSMDVMWYKAPRFKVGQEGIWFLHKDQFKQLKIQGIEGYSALDPGDTYPIGELSRIKRLVKDMR